MRSRSVALLLPILAAFVATEATRFRHPTTEDETLAAIADRLELGGTLRFVVVGDTQDDGTTGGGINDNRWPQMAFDMNAHDPDFALFCGDLISGSGSTGTHLAQWTAWDVATSPLNAVRLMVPGNHDMYVGANGLTLWSNQFSWLPSSNGPAGETRATYYVDVGNTRIISATTDYPSGGWPPNQSWLDGVLQSSSAFEHVFVFSHRPIQFSQHDPTGGSGGAFWQSMVQNGVTGYFSGHWHRYQPDQIGAGGDTWEVIIGTGGGWQGFEPIRPYQQIPGYLLVEVDGTEATGTFFGDTDGDGSWDDAMDSFVFAQAAADPVGLVAEYTFESGDGADTAPSPLGKQIDGVLRGGATIGTGLDGSLGLHLDGDGDHVECGAIGDYNLSLNDDLTVGLFADYDTLGSGYWDNVLISYGTGDYYTEDEETNFSYWLNIQDDRTLVFYWEYENGADVTLESSIPAPGQPGEVHHYAVTRDAGAMLVRFWVDGVQLGLARSFNRLPTSGGRGMLYLGASPIDYQGSGQEFDGVLDDVKIFNRVLDAGELADLAQPAPCGFDPFCVTSPNSMGPGAALYPIGLPSLSGNALELQVAAASANMPGIFYFGPNQMQAPFGNGFRCVGGSVFRLPVIVTDSFGDGSYEFDFTDPALPTAQIAPGDEWNFQFWYRDPVGGGANFNLSDALEITFCE